jgi:hypothetical protein
MVDYVVPGMIDSSAGALSNRNKIINGAMVIDQRNAGASVNIASAGGVYFITDRFFIYNSNTGTLTGQRSTTAPPGFINSLLFTVTGTSAGSSQTAIYQRIEGLNIADLAFGTANAATVTLSFWVRSSVTGIYNCALRNSTQGRSYVTTYTINSANTWEQKTITIAGDTTGSWATDNTMGMEVLFSLGTGATQTANAWAAPGYIASSGTTNLTATNGATFYITGVQLERGSVATAFEYRNYQQELAMCQRYFWLAYATNGYPVLWRNQTTVYPIVKLATTMRATPTLVKSGTVKVWSATVTDASDITVSLVTTSSVNPDNCKIDATAAGAGATASGLFGFTYGDGNFQFSAEL